MNFTIEEEKEATYFAMCFLMPEEKFLEKVRENIHKGEVDIKSIANILM